MTSFPTSLDFWVSRDWTLPTSGPSSQRTPGAPFAESWENETRVKVVIVDFSTHTHLLLPPGHVEPLHLRAQVAHLVHRHGVLAQPHRDLGVVVLRVARDVGGGGV